MRLSIGLMGAGLVCASWIAFSSAAWATMPMQKKAKELGLPADGCQYCHADKLPKKDAAGLNDRGKWLVEQKAKRSAKDIDMSWLKEYPGDKK